VIKENKIRDTAISGQVSVDIDFCMLVVVMRDTTQQFTFATLPFLASTQLHTRFLLRFLKLLSIMIV